MMRSEQEAIFWLNGLEGIPAALLVDQLSDLRDGAVLTALVSSGVLGTALSFVKKEPGSELASAAIHVLLCGSAAAAGRAAIEQRPAEDLTGPDQEYPHGPTTRRL